MEPKDEVKIDYQSIVQQITDRVVVELMSSFMPDEQSRKLVQAMAAVHRKYGIDAATSMKIMMEIGTIFTEEGKETHE